MNPKFFKIFREKDIMAATNLSRATVANWKRGVKNDKLDAFYKANISKVELVIEFKKQGVKLRELNSMQQLTLTRYQFEKM